MPHTILYGAVRAEDNPAVVVKVQAQERYFEAIFCQDVSRVCNAQRACAGSDMCGVSAALSSHPPPNPPPRTSTTARRPPARCSAPPLRRHIHAPCRLICQYIADIDADVDIYYSPYYASQPLIYYYCLLCQRRHDIMPLHIFFALFAHIARFAAC